jgi:hypothetical protein
MTGAIRIKPGVQLDSAGMGFAHRKSQWIIIWRRGPAHLSGQIFRPRFERRRVKSVAGGANLQENGVQMQSFRLFQQPHQFGLLLRSGKSRTRWPVEVLD